MTDSYLQSLGFAPTPSSRNSSRLAFSHAWSYQHTHLAADGTRLFIEHPLGVDSCRLSTVETPLDQQHVFASLPLHDEPALVAATAAYFAAHGGIGELAPPLVPYVYRPFRRLL